MPETIQENKETEKKRIYYQNNKEKRNAYARARYAAIRKIINEKLSRVIDTDVK